LVRKTEGKRLLGRCRRRFGDNVTIDFMEIGWEVMGFIYVALHRD
jgi:hypothetical protein